MKAATTASQQGEKRAWREDEVGGGLGPGPERAYSTPIGQHLVTVTATECKGAKLAFLLCQRGRAKAV